MASASRARTGRQQQRADTDNRILAAARDLFGELGYDGCTVRGIAERADVDPALVVRRFGGKDQLFLRVVKDMWPLQRLSASAGDQDDLVARWVAAFVDKVEDGDTELAALRTILRAALIQPETAELLRSELFEHAAGTVLATAIPGPLAAERAQLAAAALVGITLARHILRVEPLASLGSDRLVAVLEPMLRGVVRPPSDEASG